MPAEEGPTKAAQTKDRILRAAIERFGFDGFRAASVAVICRDAEVSGSLAYAYFENKEALFRAALDSDTRDLLVDGVAANTVGSGRANVGWWRAEVLPSLLAALDEHPLVRRVLGGLEPQATAELLHMPALEELRALASQRLALGQESGVVRTDIDAVAMGRVMVHLWVMLLMAAVQFGAEGVEDEVHYIETFLAAAITVVPSA